MGEATLLSDSGNTSIVYNIKATSQDDVGLIDLSLTGLSSDIISSFSKNTIAISDNITLTITIPFWVDIAEGTYNFTLNAVAESVEKHRILSFTINDASSGIDLS